MQQAINMQEAVEMFPDGARVMRSGFMGAGTPDGLVRALAASGKRDLTKIFNDAARADTGVGPLVSTGCMQRQKWQCIVVWARRAMATIHVLDWASP